MAVTTKIIVQQILNIDDTKATASKFPRYTVTLGNSISSITASELVSSIEAAAKSAAAAKDSEIAAKTSELNAKDSEQEAAISAGASEASATQSATSATQSAASADRSAESAAAAKVSETNAKASETKAKTSETNAKASETNAKSSETKAKASETNAKTSETNAAASAAAKISETNAKISETNAAESAASAADSKGFRDEAEAFAAQAAASAAAAKVSETKAKTSETNAKSSETKAKASETNAASSATSASQSVTTIQGLKSDVEELKSDTQTIKNSAVTETTALKNQAATSATNAAASATEAGKQATNAANSANNAKTEADRSKTEADRAKAEADKTEVAISNTTEVQPFPDVWIPFNDSLDMLAGFAPGYKQITVGDDVVNMVSDKVVDFKRASGATYINKSGVLTVAEVDEPRFEREGLLIEGQRTNYHLNSLTPSKWGATTSVTITESGVDEFGFTYGRFQIKDEKIGTNTTMNIAAVPGGRGVDVTGNEKYVTTSCRVKSDNANIQCRIRFEGYDGSAYFYLADAYLNITDMSIRKTGGGAARITARAEKESNGWIYFEVTYQSEDTDNMVGSQIQIAPPVSPGTYSGGEYLQVATPQFEGGSCASSFIISETTPATRASDLVTIPIKNNLYNAPLSCLVEVNKNWDVAPNLAPRIFDISGFKTANDALVFGFRSATGNGRPYVQFGSIVSFPSVDSDRKLIAGFVRNVEGNFKVVSNGTFSTPTKSSWVSVNGAHTIRIGYNLANGERSLFGHIRNFRIWHKALTDRQLKESV